MSSEKKKCEHLNFHAKVDVGRLSRTEGGPIENYCIEVEVKCTDCGVNFEFIGVEAGLSYNYPTSNVDFTVLRAPIMPASGKMATQLNYEMPPKNKTSKKDIN